jgi:hypothetical protein
MHRNLSIVAFLSVLIGLLILPAIGKKIENKADGAKVFAEYCTKCHTGGGNVLNESKPVAESKQLSTLAVFKSYLSSPPGHMPYYQNIVENKKTLDALYKYCKQLKKKPSNQA